MFHFGASSLFQYFASIGITSWSNPSLYLTDQSKPVSNVQSNALITNGWTTLELVTDGGCNFSQNGNTSGSPIVRVSDQGSLDCSLLSQLLVKSGCKIVATW